MDDPQFLAREEITTCIGQTGARRSKMMQLLDEELGAIHLRLWFSTIWLRPLPTFVGSRLRAYALRLAGFKIGQGTVMWGMPHITGGHALYQHLVIGRECVLNSGCILDLQEAISIGDHVAL